MRFGCNVCVIACKHAFCKKHLCMRYSSYRNVRLSFVLVVFSPPASLFNSSILYGVATKKSLNQAEDS